MKQWYHRALIFLFFGVLPVLARAQEAVGDGRRSLRVGVGTDLTFVQLATNIINFLARGIVALGIALFMIGALMIVVSRGQDPHLSKGKDLIIYSLIGIAVVLGVMGIARTVFYLIFYA